MSKTTLLFLALFVGGLAGGILHPVYPLLAYLLDYYQHPPLRWWGKDLPEGFRWSFVASMVMLGATFLHGKFPLSRATLRHWPVHGLLGFALIALLVTPFAVSVDRSLRYLEMLWQLALLVLVMVVSLDSPKRWRLVVLVMTVGSLTWGVDAWLDPERVAGRLQAIGGADSFNDNAAAVHLLAMLPFMAVMGIYGSRIERGVALVSFPFVVNTIILCNSRGATLAMACMGGASLLLTRGRQRRGLLWLSAAGAAAFLFLADPQFLERQATILSEERDGSSEGRVVAWIGALELMRDYPLGAGGGGFDALSPVYIPQVVARYGGAERTVHNTYLWVGSDWGIAGLIAFCVFLFGTLVRVQQARRRAPDVRMDMEGVAVQAAIIGISVGGFFINRTYGEIMYWVPALGLALVNLIDSQAATDAGQPPRSGADVPADAHPMARSA